MEQQHPIPQQISAYQFRLVGDMTLKQFFQVAGGALIALLIYSSSFASYIKWPLIFFSFLMGVALAFFPLQDRPLSKWIILFLKAIYSPTLYAWRRSPAKPSFFQPEPHEEAATPSAQTVDIIPINPSPAIPEEISLSILEQKEEEFLKNVNKQFASTTTPPNPILKHQVPVIRPQIIAGEISIPKPPPPQVVHQDVKPTAKPILTVQDLSASYGNASLITPMAKQASASSQVAQFSAEAAPPSPPIKPNVVVGQVLDSEGKMLESVILDIRDGDGRAVRALKTNKLGHFMIVTPLANGKYEIITEKEGYSFIPQSFEARGEIIPPIAIWAKSGSVSEVNQIYNNAK
ncbi:MAG: hypothetical protein US60_C0050G0004 [Microgenomates group bacterium GW2011_GWC1_37_8]|uniref:Minus agglutinin n=1 Tax=Candidatus Woesebacteria bacterium GW2011_GWB1_38_8 TaxID=1618570 RepID=A0A0G0L100_9BACT|nr:MAG: hypothetical protein US60_C0050G0004 [Microgenomates group bacterium GW2011_GWC1_37_8]KKQ85598.1 MAG: hypothetical protein UT08_C0005G0049 [Candidatus Woesebacteria bacterium GW2011_GWB1_38_8]